MNRVGFSWPTRPWKRPVISPKVEDFLGGSLKTLEGMRNGLPGLKAPKVYVRQIDDEIIKLRYTKNRQVSSKVHS